MRGRAALLCMLNPRPIAHAAADNAEIVSGMATFGNSRHLDPSVVFAAHNGSHHARALITLNTNHGCLVARVS
jgi:hypothetical protein